MATSPKRRYTWKRDHFDSRDHELLVTAPARPSAMDLRGHCPAVYDQGNLGSCTGNAWAAMLEYLELKAGAEDVARSRLFIYYQERVIEGTVRHDDGAQIRDGAKALHTVGSCSEALWPYKVREFAKKPPKKAYADAGAHKISEYMRCSSQDAALQSIADGFPVVFGFNVYEAFEGPLVAKTGTLNLPQPGEKNVGGHAVLMVGYDDAAQRVIVRNSWGPSWGQSGYFTMPYAYAFNHRLADDFWTVRK